MWAHFLVAGSARQWAQLTLVAPASASIAAALRFGDQVTVGGGHLAHGLQNLDETEPLTIIQTFCS